MVAPSQKNADVPCYRGCDLSVENENVSNVLAKDCSTHYENNATTFAYLNFRFPKESDGSFRRGVPEALFSKSERIEVFYDRV